MAKWYRLLILQLTESLTGQNRCVLELIVAAQPGHVNKRIVSQQPANQDGRSAPKIRWVQTIGKVSRLVI